MKTALFALLYASLSLGAITAQADDRSEALKALRDAELRNLLIHDDPSPFQDIAFTDADGNPMKLSDSNGKVRIVNFWATYCGPCRVEKPALDALHKSLSGPDFEVIAIATGRNSPAAIKKFNERYDIQNLDTYIDVKSAAARDMGVMALPVSVILDRQGRELARVTGAAHWESQSTRDIINHLVKAPES